VAGLVFLGTQEAEPGATCDKCGRETPLFFCWQVGARTMMFCYCQACFWWAKLAYGYQESEEA
jgi:hypothetical protein